MAPLGRLAALVAAVCFMTVFGVPDTGSPRAKPKRDKKPPVVTGAQPDRLPDADGWYNHPVRVVFSGAVRTDHPGDHGGGGPGDHGGGGPGDHGGGGPGDHGGGGPGGQGAGDEIGHRISIARCTAATYSGPDSADATVIGYCFDAAGKASDPFAFHFKYDATPPVVQAVTSNRAARSGWFNRPVRFAVHAADATSGLAVCPAVTYAGPDSARAWIGATCRDRAGNVATRAFSLKYDTAPPALDRLRIAVGDRRVTLRWPASAHDRTVRVVRSPAFARARPAVALTAARARFVDTHVVNGRRYTYAIRAADAAGNVSRRRVVAVPHAHLMRPVGGAVVAAGTRLVLRWTPVRRARYYNVQLFRDGRKVLSQWPAKPSYRLPAQWVYHGRPVRLDPGAYQWLVWPGRGPRSNGEYGARVGRLAFTVP
jgi:hypothetical protein